MRKYKGFDLFFIFGSVGFFFVLLMILIGFLNGINANSYLLEIGNGSIVRKVVSRHRFGINLNGLILSSSFMISTLSMFLLAVFMIAVPRRRRVPEEPDQKVNRLSEEETPVQETIPEKDHADEDLIERTSPKEPVHLASVTESDLINNTMGKELPNNVVYGSGEIDEASMADFIYGFPDSSIKFAFDCNIDGTSLPEGTKEMHRKWNSRGLNPLVVKNKIQEILNWEIIGKNRLGDISLELKKQTEEYRNAK